VADYVILLSTLYDRIFLWQSYTHNTNQFLCWISLRIVETATSDLMSWNRLTPCPLCWVCYQGHLNMLTWHLTQQNGKELNHSIIDPGQCFFPNFLRLCGWWAYQEWFNRKNLITKMPLNKNPSPDLAKDFWFIYFKIWWIFSRK
jgi:hypothetical protein